MNNNFNSRKNVVQGLEGGRVHVFLGSGIWPKYMYGEEWENAKYLDRKWNLTATQEAGFTKMLFGHGMWEFFASLSGIQELGKWAEKKTEREGEETLHSPLPFFQFFPYASTYWGMKGCLIFCNFLKLTCVNTKYHS